MRPFSSARARIRVRSRPLPSSVIEISTLSPAWRGGAGGRRGAAPPPPARPPRRAVMWGVEAVVDRIADQVRPRVVQALDHGLVEFGFLAAGGEVDLLAELP